MKLLAWDTSSKVGSLVALEWDEFVSDCSWEDVRLVAELTLGVEAVSHSECLLWGIHQTLEAARWKLEDVHLLGVGVGPGSFTGLRIGITTAQFLSYSLGKPVVGVSSLKALIQPLLLLQEKIVAVAVTDACKGELFALWGEVNEALSPQADFQERVLNPLALKKELEEILSGSGDRKLVVVGEGRLRYPDLWSPLQKYEKRFPFSFSRFVQGRFLGQVVWENFQAGLIQDAFQLRPRYLRPSSAEQQQKKRSDFFYE